MYEREVPHHSPLTYELPMNWQIRTLIENETLAILSKYKGSFLLGVHLLWIQVFSWDFPYTVTISHRNPRPPSNESRENSLDILRITIFPRYHNTSFTISKYFNWIIWHCIKYKEVPNWLFNKAISCDIINIIQLKFYNIIKIYCNIKKSKITKNI